MVRKRVISVLVGVGLAGALAAGCVGTRSDDFSALSLTGRAAAAAEAARVVRVVDADTYILLSGSSTYRLRLLGVDAPEHDQAFGPQATDSVARLLAPGRVVLVAKAGLDLYGRTLGMVLLPTSTVAATGRPVPLDSLLVMRGWAWAFDPNRTVAARAAQQVAAQQAGRGLWKCGAAGAVPPKLWRSFNATIKRRYQGTCTW
ncbi:thermonuclease family protein [Hymenobacter caeli]|uniref:Endonuclease YncB(Thermonuclease family) n=1 Tax=Hymenobacter caeli TaxID=2735894 RepID=A0ABX2FQA4_9BACT|nr:thermonuclease family protein [Hymenobacter caeli]NRT19343.1 endonuclease YncB(thermonuclease family) [Hymenobacter caeli]